MYEFIVLILFLILIFILNFVYNKEYFQEEDKNWLYEWKDVGNGHCTNNGPSGDKVSSSTLPSLKKNI